MLSKCIDNNNIKLLLDEFNLFLNENLKNDKLTISFIGQYNAGKSSIIASITNAKFKKKYFDDIDGNRKLIEIYSIEDKEIKIGAQIMTDQTNEYNWKNTLLIDTPGIYAGREEHDKITLDKISKSDLLIFVITNELFNPQSGIFFRKIINDMQRIGQIILIVNKMSREAGIKEKLIESITKVTEPFLINDFHTCFIDADYYLKAINESDEKESFYLKNKSNFLDLFKSLDILIKKNSLNSKLLTPLHCALDILKKAYIIISSNDTISKDLLELLRRKYLKISAFKTRVINYYNGELNKLEHEKSICWEIKLRIKLMVNMMKKKLILK